MKIEPLAILLSKNFNLNKKFYFISGNETTLIEKISDKIIESFREQTNISLKNIGSIDEYVDEVGLFEEKKAIIIKSCKGINDGVLNNLKASEDIFIFIEVNSPKIKISLIITDTCRFKLSYQSTFRIPLLYRNLFPIV